LMVEQQFRVCVEGYLSRLREKGMGQWLGEVLATPKEP